MYSVAVCIPTFKRPAGLEQLILSICKCNMGNGLVKEVHIIVVDNDEAKSAEPVAKQMSAKVSHVADLNYFNYPTKGLANVRNEMLRQGLELNTDFLIFIDDDEYVTHNWMMEILTTIINNNADAVRGPVIANVSAAAPNNIKWFFKREKYNNNQQIHTWTTGNLVLRTSTLKKCDVWFDNRFNATGSEDGFFGIQMEKQGATLHWAAHAVAFETIPDSRANVKWIVKRTFRLSSTFVYILILEKSYYRLLRKILVSFSYIFIGIPSLLLLMLPFQKKYWGLVKLSEGFGGLAGLVNVSYSEYK